MKEFFIKSYYCATWLQMHGISPKRIELTPKKYRIFFYDDTALIKTLIDDFYRDEYIQKYTKCCVEIKNAMHNNTHDKGAKNESNPPNLH